MKILNAIDIIYKDKLEIWKFFWNKKPQRILVIPIYEEEKSIEFWPLKKDEITEDLKNEIQKAKKIKKSDLYCI